MQTCTERLKKVKGRNDKNRYYEAIFLPLGGNSCLRVNLPLLSSYARYHDAWVSEPRWHSSKTQSGFGYDNWPDWTILGKIIFPIQTPGSDVNIQQTGAPVYVSTKVEVILWDSIYFAPDHFLKVHKWDLFGSRNYA